MWRMTQLRMFRKPLLRATYALPGELVVDNFAGGGGASTGIEAALGRPADIAINHDPVAISMHRVNHPRTKHFCENIWDVDPREACGSRPVGLAWFSPDCTHFSRAKGTQPVKKEIRGLAWVVIRWARTVKPRVIILENVEEFQTWGPLSEGRPDPTRTGSTFRAWLSKLVACGYTVEFRSLVAADYGAPTTRKRLYLIARRDDAPIAWPDETHGEGRRRCWRPAAEVIDWSIPCPSIFERERSLAVATQRRIAEGIKRFVLECADPFLVTLRGTDRAHLHADSIGSPLRTVSASGTHHALVAPTLIARSWGERKGQSPRVPGLGKPLGTIMAGGVKHALVAAFLSKHYGGVVGHGLERPVGTVTGRDHHALTTATLAPTTDHSADVRAFLISYYGTGVGQRASDPLRTVTTRDRFGLVVVEGVEYAISDIGMRMLAPHELYAAQGFPDDYIIDALSDGRPINKTAQIRLVGNSVCPPVARALVAAQVAA